MYTEQCGSGVASWFLHGINCSGIVYCVVFLEKRLVSVPAGMLWGWLCIGQASPPGGGVEILSLSACWNAMEVALYWTSIPSRRGEGV